MKAPKPPKNEQERLGLLHDLDILDTLEEECYDDLTRLAAKLCDTPISLVSLIDEKRQWFKSKQGLEVTETPRELAFCAHAILDKDLLYIPDSSKDERFRDNPLVTGDPHVKFYAGMPLELKNGLRVGTLCVIDQHPKTLTPDQKESLKALARQVTSQLHLRLKVKELQERDQKQSEFLAMISHELRTPMTSIIGNLSLLNSGIIDDAKKEKEMIYSSFVNSQILIRLVNDILDLGKIESEGFTLQKKAHSVKTTLNKAITNIHTYLEKCQVNIVSEFDPNLGMAVYDEDRILKIFNNLISNAAKFSPSKSTLTLTAKKTDHFIIFGIKDKGSGIPKEVQENIFEKFSDIKNKNNKNIPGSGLGLNISRKLVELHHGKIWFKSVEGEGTTFFFKIPID